VGQPLTTVRAVRDDLDRGVSDLLTDLVATAT